MADTYLAHGGLWELLFNIVIWFLAIGAGYYMIASSSPRWEEVPKGMDVKEHDLEVLKKRYENSEISREEYEDLVRRIGKQA